MNDCTCLAQPELGPHRFGCPVSIRAARRLRELNAKADDMGIGYGVTVDATEPEDDWFEGEDGYLREPLSYENREGDPAFSGAFDKW